jgi:hypothetical protein
MSYSAVRPEPPHNNRNSYQTGSCPGFVLGVTLMALLLGLSSLSHAVGSEPPASGVTSAPSSPAQLH